ncbi:glycosyltransferase [Roseomonas sp. BN140053]|uniref:glycosyltransferase n=1 Tax=Roseomonas sp. BN140053 TaxID=3391898 RepID=UPI0039EAEAA4
MSEDPGGVLAALDAQATAAEARGDLAVAAQALAMLAVARPEDGGLQLRLGSARHGTGDLLGAVEAWQRAIELGPTSAWPFLALGYRALNSQCPGRALEYFRKAIAHAPGVFEARFVAAKAAADLGWTDLAVRLFRDVVSGRVAWWDSTAAQTRAALAEHRATARELLALRRQARRAVPPGTVADLAPDRALKLAEALLRTGRLRPAGRLLDAPALRDTVRAVTLRLRLVQRRDGAAAAAALANADRRHAGDPGWAAQAAISCAEAGDLAAAAEHLHALPEARQSNQTRSLLAVILLGHGDTEAARALVLRWRAVAAGNYTTPSRYLLSAELLAKRLPLLREPAQAAAARPGTVVQFWHSDTVPPDVAALMAGWAAGTPGLAHRLFSAASAREWLRARVGEAAAARLDRCYHPAMQADLFRLYYLREEGGIYVDADERCQRSLAPIFAALDESELILTLALEAPAYAHNFFLAARPNSAVIARAVSEAEGWLDSGDPRPPIWDATGPGCLTRALGHALLGAADAAATRRLVSVMTLPHYRSFALTEENLAYRHTPGQHWTSA